MTNRAVLGPARHGGHDEHGGHGQHASHSRLGLAVSRLMASGSPPQPSPPRLAMRELGRAEQRGRHDRLNKGAGGAMGMRQGGTGSQGRAGQAEQEEGASITGGGGGAGGAGWRQHLEGLQPEQAPGLQEDWKIRNAEREGKE